MNFAYIAVVLPDCQGFRFCPIPKVLEILSFISCIEVVDPEKNEWEAVKQLPEGAWIKVLSADEETGAFSALFKFDKGFHAF